MADRYSAVQWQRREELKASRRNASAAIASLLCIVGTFSVIYFVFTNQGGAFSWWVLFFYISMFLFLIAALSRILHLNYELARDSRSREPVVVVAPLPPAPSYVSVDLPPSYSQAYVYSVPIRDDRIPSTQTLQHRELIMGLRPVSENFQRENIQETTQQAEAANESPEAPLTPPPNPEENASQVGGPQGSAEV